MLLINAKLAAATFIVGTAFIAAAHAQGQYQTAGVTAQRLITPPSWSYDPYTSGLGPCPQRTPSDLQTCRETMPPTYGQPDYRPR